MAEKVIKVCDRCGKERKSMIQPKLTINKGIDRLLGRTRYETQILCEDCEKSLVEWFNGVER